MSILAADINGFISKTHARWVVEGGVEDEWDDYLTSSSRRRHMERDPILSWLSGSVVIFGKACKLSCPHLMSIELQSSTYMALLLCCRRNTQTSLQRI